MRRISIREKKSSFKVAVIGAKSVGKSALTVRIKTRKFIHTYAPNLETKCSFYMPIGGESVLFEILDTAALQTAENAKIEEKIKWADAFILLYSITDGESLSALVASKLLINLYAKRKKKLSNESSADVLVALVGNKNDLEHERVITEEQGMAFADENKCSLFFEISARQSYDGIKAVFETLYTSYRMRSPKLSQRATLRPSALLHDSISENSDDEAEKLLAIKQRGRSRTTLETGVSTESLSCRSSPVTLRKLVGETSNIVEATAAYLSSPDDDPNFLERQTCHQNVDLPPTRRMAVCYSPNQRGSNGPYNATNIHPASYDQNNNRNINIPFITLSHYNETEC